MTKKDIKAILKHGEAIYKIAEKYGLDGNLAEIYLKAYQELRRLRRKVKS